MRTRAGWVIGGLSLLILLVVALLLLTPREASSERQVASALPLLNASLNGATAVLLAAGYFCIRRRLVRRHRLCMLSAFSLSVLFLVSYVIYHTIAGSTHFDGPAWLRPIYFTVLLSHVVLASLILPLALTTVYRAWRRGFAQHRRIARWTLPIWLYVSVSGVAVYIMLYRVP